MVITTILESRGAYGYKQAVEWHSLLNAAELSDRRGLYAEIANERQQGSLILTNFHGGYYLPSKDEHTGAGEVRANIRRFESMGVQNIKIARCLKKGVEETEGQTSLSTGTAAENEQKE